MRNWNNQELIRIQEREQEAALKAVSDFSALISKRLYRQKRFLWAIRGGLVDGSEEDVSEYRFILIEWNDKFREIQARLSYSFGNNLALLVEDDFQSELTRLNSILDELAKDEVNESSGELSVAENRLNILGHKSISLTTKLLRKIRNLELPVFQEKNEISFKNRSNLQVGRLLFRLFGIGGHSLH